MEEQWRIDKLKFKHQSNNSLSLCSWLYLILLGRARRSNPTDWYRQRSTTDPLVEHHLNRK